MDIGYAWARDGQWRISGSVLGPQARVAEVRHLIGRHAEVYSASEDDNAKYLLLSAVARDERTRRHVEVQSLKA
jgi:hypothetical protein